MVAIHALLGQRAKHIIAPHDCFARCGSSAAWQEGFCPMHHGQGSKRRAPRLSMLGNRTMLLDTRSALPAAKTTDPFYLSPEWRALVADIIRERSARCEDPTCRFPGRSGVRVFGDHIVELKDGGAPLDKTNVMLRCGSCHTRRPTWSAREGWEPEAGRGIKSLGGRRAATPRFLTRRNFFRQPRRVFPAL